jgi:hypothetical protein
MTLLARVNECNAHDLGNFLPFFVEGTRVGWVKKPFSRRLARFGEEFAVAADAVAIAPHLATPEARSAAMARVVACLVEDGAVRNARGEMYGVGTDFAAPPLLKMERAAAPLFGVRAYGVHLNGFVRMADGTVHLWVGHRSTTTANFPGELDNLVAGGQPVGLGLAENLVKECGEEASIPPELARCAVPVGCVSYCLETEEGLRPDVLFCYDLDLPPDFVPRNNDGEVASFYLWPVEKVMQVVASTREFKFNCNLVNIDFFVRHGYLKPDHPDYVRILHGLHA